MNKEITLLEKQIAEKTAALRSVTKKIEQLENEKRELDNNTPTLHVRHIIDEKRWSGIILGILGYLGWTDFTFNYSEFSSIPYVKRDILTNKGAWKIENESPDKAILVARYTTNYGEDGNAEIVVYVEKRNIPANAARFKQIKEELISLTNQNKDISAKLDELLKEKDNKLKESKVNDDSLREELATKERYFSRLEIEIPELERKLKCEYLQPFIEDLELFRILKSLIPLVGLKTTEGIGKNFGEFCELLNKYLQEYYPVNDSNLQAISPNNVSGSTLNPSFFIEAAKRERKCNLRYANRANVLLEHLVPTHGRVALPKAKL